MTARLFKGRYALIQRDDAGRVQSATHDFVQTLTRIGDALKRSKSDYKVEKDASDDVRELYVAQVLALHCQSELCVESWFRHFEPGQGDPDVRSRE